jgi:hypothetical protein
MRFTNWSTRARAAIPSAAWRRRLPPALQAAPTGLGNVIVVFLLSRFAFYAAAFVGIAVVPEYSSNVRVPVNAPLALALHWRWDAIHYYSVAAGGYNFYYSQPMPGNAPEVLHAFFPLMPAFMRDTAALINGLRWPASQPITSADRSMLLAGVLVVNVATLVALWLLFQLAHEETRDAETAGRAVFYAAVFPLAFYYAVPYAEAVFLATSIGAFLAARRQHWVRAGLWAAFASAARPFGILLLPVLMLEMAIAAWHGELRGRAWLRAFLGLVLAPLGLLLFMLELRRSTGDALAFIAVQRSAWGREPRFPLATLRLGLNYALHPTRSHDPATYARTVLHTAIVVGFLAIIVLSVRRWRPSFVLYGLLLYAVMLSSPWPGETIMHSLGRSAMVFFPVYITLAQWGRRPVVHQAILALWLPLFGLLAALYVSWYFVA